MEWEDTLPITAQPPFRYTTDTPFQYPTTDEEGSPTTSLTRLGRLAVKMKWIDDPTADGAQGAPLPTAEELLEKCGRAFSWSWRARICAPWPEYCTSCTTAPW